MKAIETSRLVLREMEPTDLEGMFEPCPDPEVHRFWACRSLGPGMYKEKFTYGGTRHNWYALGKTDWENQKTQVAYEKG